MTLSLLQAVHHSCEEALAIAARFATSSNLPPCWELKQRATDLLEHVAVKGAEAGLSHDDVSDIRYAVVAFIDEQILKSSWEGKQDWMLEPLQLVYFHETTAGEGFFARLADLENHPERTHVLLAYYLCMVLGFQGMYAIRDHGAIEAHVASAASKLSKMLPDLDSLCPHGIPSDSGRQRSGKTLPIFAMAIAVVLLAVVGYAGLRMAVRMSASDAALDINESAEELRTRDVSEHGR